MRVQSINILQDFDVSQASYDSVDASPSAHHHQEDNQVIIKPIKQDSNSNSSHKEEEKEHPIQYAGKRGRALSADVSDTCKNQSAKLEVDCIVNIKGQAHKIRPMSPRAYRRWSRHHSSSLIMHRLKESCSNLDEQDSWKEISQVAQLSNQDDD